MESKIEEIKDKFRSVISHSQCIPDPAIDELFQEWLDGKRDFIEAMQGKLIYEYPETICFELSDQEKSKRVDEFISRISEFYCNDALAHFIDTNRENFFSNIAKRFITPDGAQVPAGMRLVKAFKYFENDAETLNKIQIEASMIIQQDKIEGTLCLSVHPLDFLSSSENTHNWRSCHALDGEYRSGNLSYMTDNCTIMCYLKSKNDEKLPNFPEDVPWNSKKWRMLLHFSNDWTMLFAGRQYPFFSKTALEIVSDDLLPRAMNQSGWCDWSNYFVNNLKPLNEEPIFLNWNYFAVNGELVKLTDIVTDGEDAMNFNDLLRSSFYTPYYTMKRHRYGWIMAHPATTKIKVGHSAPCIRCGKNHIRVNESMMCCNCEEDYGSSDNDDFGYCACCDRHFYLDDALWIDDSPICPECVENGEVVTCSRCGMWIFKDTAIYDKKTGGPVCQWCHSNLELERRREANGE